MRTVIRPRPKNRNIDDPAIVQLEFEGMDAAFQKSMTAAIESGTERSRGRRSLDDFVAEVRRKRGRKP